MQVNVSNCLSLPSYNEIGFSVPTEMSWLLFGPIVSLLSTKEPSLMGSGDLLHQGHRHAELLNEMNHLVMYRPSWDGVLEPALYWSEHVLHEGDRVTMAWLTVPQFMR